MITIKTMYDFYSLTFKNNINEVKEEIIILENTKALIIKSLYTNNIPEYIILDKDKIEKGELELISSPFTNKEKFYNIQVDNLKDYIIRINNRKRYIKEQESKLIPFKIYAYIIKRFNMLLTEAIINEAYEFFDLFLGKLYIITTDKRRPSIDWKKSNENKNKLLEEGKIQYLKADAEKAKEEGKEYKGIQWLENIKTLGMFFKWELKNVQYVRIPNLANYNFIPYDSRRGPVEQLNSLRKKYTEEELIKKFKKDNVN